MVRKLPMGNWGLPFNLGPNINTAYDEDAPFVTSSGNVLYFSSRAHKNMGGFDVFRSNFDAYGKFSQPMNLGYPINSVGDDIFFVLNKDSSRAYLSSNRKGGYGSQDIYEISFSDNPGLSSVYSISVFDESDKVLKKVELELVNLETNELFGMYKANKKTGNVMVISEVNKEYEMTILAKGFEPFTTRVILNKDNSLSYKLKRE